MLIKYFVLESRSHQERTSRRTLGLSLPDTRWSSNEIGGGASYLGRIIRLNSFSRLDNLGEVQVIECGMLPRLIDLPNFLLKDCDMILPIGTGYVRN